MSDPDAGNHSADVHTEALAEQVIETARDYGSQADYLSRVAARANDRSQAVVSALRAAFASAIKREECEVIALQQLNVMELALAIERYPIILKPLLASCNVAGRALERDLDLR